MNRSNPSINYIIPPDSVPGFLESRASHLKHLVKWAQDEHQRYLVYCAERGYFREVKILNQTATAVYFLAKMSGFRRICSKITDREWNALTVRERRFIIDAFELREKLMMED